MSALNRLRNELYRLIGDWKLGIGTQTHFKFFYAGQEM